MSSTRADRSVAHQIYCASDQTNRTDNNNNNVRRIMCHTIVYVCIQCGSEPCSRFDCTKFERLFIYSGMFLLRGTLIRSGKPTKSRNITQRCVEYRKRLYIPFRFSSAIPGLQCLNLYAHSADIYTAVHTKLTSIVIHDCVHESRNFASTLPFKLVFISLSPN